MQITCHCSSYSFPHRLGGGSCNSSDWASFVLTNGLFEGCASCQAYKHQAECDVASGSESIKECEYYQELIANEQWTNLPCSLEDLLNYI